MSQPTQPNQPLYPIDALNIFPVYTTRAAYQQAAGQQAPPFDPSQPVKGWADPNPAGTPYNVFDPASGAVKQLTLPAAQAGKVNLPGVYNYAPYVSAPTDAIIVGPNGPAGNSNPDQFCLLADAQEIANEIAPLFPGQPLSIVIQPGGIFYFVYMLCQSRPWTIQFGKNTPILAQSLILAKNSHGVGAPGHWALQSGYPNWVAETPQTQAPPNATSEPIPIRPLLANEKIVLIQGPSPFNQGGWMVERTDLQQAPQPETSDQQFADLKTTLAAIRLTLGAIQTKVGA